jgi:hypothetical protein
MRAFGCIALALLAACASPRPQECRAAPAREPTVADLLLDRLSSSDLDERMAAVKALSDLGIMAESALREHVDDADPEVAVWCRWLVAQVPPSDAAWYDESGLCAIDLQRVALAMAPRDGLDAQDYELTRSVVARHVAYCQYDFLHHNPCQQRHRDEPRPFLTCDKNVFDAVMAHVGFFEDVSYEEYLRRVARKAGVDVEYRQNGEIHFLSRKDAFAKWWCDQGCRALRHEMRPHVHYR